MSAKETAKAIRKVLKFNFKGVKFSVVSENFSGGDAVRVHWTDGPTYDSVDDLVRKYQYGSFNSMEDIYEHTNKIEDIPQAKFIQIQREYSVSTKRACIGEIEMKYGVEIETEESINNFTKKPQLEVLTRRVECIGEEVYTLIRQIAYNKSFNWDLK